MCVLAHHARKTDCGEVCHALQETLGCVLACRFKVRVLRHVLNQRLTCHDAGVNGFPTHVCENVGCKTSSLAYHVGKSATLHDSAKCSSLGHLSYCFGENLFNRCMVWLSVLVKLTVTVNLIDRRGNGRLTTKRYRSMGCTSLQRRGLASSDEHLGCTLRHLAFHALSHEVTS